MYIDQLIFSAINGFAGKWHWLDTVAVFFAVYAGYILLLCLGIFLLKNWKKHWHMVAESVVAAFIVRFVLVQIFYWLHFRVRPFVNSQANLLIPYNQGQASFPSGHASFYFALATIIYGYHKKAGVFFYLASFLISFARIFVGVHWPSDVVAGALLGIFMGWILNKIFKAYQLR